MIQDVPITWKQMCRILNLFQDTDESTDLDLETQVVLGGL